MKYRIREQNELKPSGVEWLGDIPKDWQVSRLKYLAKIDTGSKDTQDNEDEGIYPFFVRSKKIQSINTYSFDGEAILTPGDGDIAEIFHHVNCKFDFHQRVYIICNFKNIIGRYLYYYMIINFKKEVKKLSAKTTVDSLRRPMFLDFPVVYHVNEQQKIANFLDEKNKIFDEAISKKEQLISKLELAKQSLISEVVTGKLKIIEQNSKLQSIKREQNELKSSGVEWLGDIPKDWQVKKLGYIFSFKNGVNTDSSNYGKGIKFINVKETINTNFIMEKDIEGSVLVSDSIIKENSVRKGDVLFNRTSETIEELALSTVYYDDKVALFGGFVIRGRQITKDLDLDFKRYCFQSIEMRKQIISYGSGSIRKNIAQTNLKNVYLFVPTITEQQKISKYLDEKLIHFDNTIEKTKQSIKKLKEAKEALISQAVTGKIEVL